MEILLILLIFFDSVNQRNIFFFICTSTKGSIVIVVIVQIKILVHYHYGAVARNISTSYWKMGTWKSGLEISLWLEKEKDKKWKKKLSLKCKACTKFEGEINSMSKLKKTWIEVYNGGRLASIKDHCNGKLHMKILHSFKASILKIPAKVVQKEVDTDVSLDEFKGSKENLTSHILLLKMIHRSGSSQI